MLDSGLNSVFSHFRGLLSTLAEVPSQAGSPPVSFISLGLPALINPGINDLAGYSRVRKDTGGERAQAGLPDRRWRK